VTDQGFDGGVTLSTEVGGEKLSTSWVVTVIVKVFVFWDMFWPYYYKEIALNGNRERSEQIQCGY